MVAPRKTPSGRGFARKSFPRELAPRTRTRPRGRSPHASCCPLPSSRRVPATVFRSISHMEWSPHRMPMPRASRHRVVQTEPIDISAIEIPSSSLRSTWLCMSIPIEPCMTMPSRPPMTVQRSTTLLALNQPVRDVDPLALRTPSMSTVQCARSHGRVPDVDPVELRARETDTWSSTTLRTPRTAIPYAPPTTRTD